MKADRLNTLLLPFEKGLLDEPTSEQSWLFLNAGPVSADSKLRARLLCEQGFRPEFLALESAGFSISPQIASDEEFSGALILTSRIRAVNEHNIQRAMRQVAKGGAIVVCGDKAAGISAIRKWVGDQIQISDSLSKHHAVCFWFENDKNELLLGSAEQKIHGMFSAAGPDKGSQLLARYFDKRVKGKVADFGSGWGYLSEALLKASDRVESLDLYEAEWSAQEAAKEKLKDFASPQITFHWIDLLSEFRKKPFEWIIMNPPFHHGLHSTKAPDAGLGISFIQTAASSLIKGGKLLMVANRNLPYEATLSKAFRKVEKLGDEGGYKVIEATK